MIITLENAGKTYQILIDKVRKGNGKIIIFVAFSIDSLCALRILVNMLRSDNVRYEIVPVMNYNQLDEKIEEFRKVWDESFTKEIRAFVMINCGGSRDMSKKWFADEVYEIILLIIDIHRPTNHNNVHSNYILLLDDGYFYPETCPSEEDIKALNEVDEEEDEFEDETYSRKEENEDEINENSEFAPKEEDDEEGEGEYTIDINGNEIKLNEEDVSHPNNIEGKKRRIKKKKENLDTIEEEHEDDVDKLVESSLIKKSSRSALQDEKRLKRKIKENKKIKARNYYSGNYFGFPAAFILYRMASQLYREDNQSLWLLIIAMTEHYLHLHIDQQQYEKLYKECHAESLRLNTDRQESFPSFLRQAKREDNMGEGEGKDTHDFSDVKVKTSHREAMSIMIETDYRLILYRHWNLFDSLVSSSYTLAHLNTWKEPGKEDIKKLLTLIGLPLEEAKQKYAYMKGEYKELFKTKIPEVSRKFDLKDFFFYSFLFQSDSKTQMSASDFVHCLAALLESPVSPVKHDEQEYEDSEDTRDSSSQQDEKQMRVQFKYDSFWYCYDFLSLKNTSQLKYAIDLGIKFQNTLVENGILLINKKTIKSNQSFRYAVINSEIVLAEQKYFTSSTALEKLALFMMYTYHNQNKNTQPKPFVLALFNSVKKNYVVAGVLGNVRDPGEKNQFPIRFRVAANNIGAVIKLEGFNDCIIEIDQDNFYSFLNELTKSSE